MPVKVETEGFNLEDLRSLEAVPGKAYELRLYVYSPLSQEKLDALQQSLIDQGIELLAPVEETLQYPTTVIIKARAPKGYGMLPFFVLLTLAIGAVVISGILGWRIGEAISKWFPVIIIGGIGTFLLYAWITKPERTRA